MKRNLQGVISVPDFAIELLEHRQLLSIATAAVAPSDVSRAASIFVGPRTDRFPKANIDLGFIDQDIGSPGQAGSLSYSSGSYTVSGGGSDIGGSSDQFNFASKAYSGDGSIIVKVATLSASNGSAKAGAMIRNSAAADAAFLGIFVTPSSGLMLTYRIANGDVAAQTIAFGPHAPQFLKLSRAGSAVSGFYSADGLTWSQAGTSHVISLGSGALVGLAVSAHDNAATASATYTNVSAFLPSGWNNTDIGSPSLSGSAAYDPASNNFAVSASGSDIGGTSDQFNFTSRVMTGDGSVVALINSLNNSDPSAKAGVMIRDSAAAGAMFASVCLTAANGLLFQWRSGTGGLTSSQSSPAITGPVWVKLSQVGGNFSAYYSSNAIAWTQVGATQSITMTSATTIAGIAATSHNNAAIMSATISGASLTRAGITDLDVGSPAVVGSAVYDAPSNTYTLTGSGTGFDPSASRVGSGRRANATTIKVGAIGSIAGADQFNFASTALSGNGNVIAYVNSVTSADPLAEAGVMVRLDNSATAAFAGAFVLAQGGVLFQWRPTAGATVLQISASSAIAAPVSLKLTRSGNSFAGYYSIDGVTWVLIGPAQTVAMPTSVLGGIATSAHDSSEGCVASFTGLYAGNTPPPGAGIYSAADELFLNDLENRETLFFYNETNASTGLVPDGSLANGGSNGSSSSIASIGFGLSAVTIGDQRGWLAHSAAYQRALTTVNFLLNSGANVNGLFYHFLNPATGARAGNSEVSSVDTVELMSGVLNVAQYWAGTPIETAAMALYNRVNWPWMQRTNGQFYGAYTPEGGLTGAYGDFSEAALLYMLAMGSSTHPTTQASWYSWSRTPVVHYSSYTFVTAGDAALFTVQYPQAWFNLQGLSDNTGLNFYTNAQTATLAQRQWMTDLSSTYSDYGPNMWGLTASDSQNGYAVWGGPPAFGPINGTVVPTAPGGSLAFTPRRSVDALEYMYQTYGSTNYRKYGFVDAFNPLNNWTSSIVLGIDVGMTLLAAENSRSNFVWDIFSQNLAARQSLAKAFPSAAQSVWMPNTSGNWNATASWNNAAIPNGVGKEADFFGAIASARTIFSDTAITAGIISFDNPSTYVISGAGSLTLQVASGAAQVNVARGTQEIDLPLTIASNTIFNVAPGATLIIGDPLTILPGKTVTVVGGGAVVYQSTGAPANMPQSRSTPAGSSRFPGASNDTYSDDALANHVHNNIDWLFNADLQSPGLPQTV